MFFSGDKIQTLFNQIEGVSDISDIIITKSLHRNEFQYEMARNYQSIDEFKMLNKNDKMKPYIGNYEK